MTYRNQGIYSVIADPHRRQIIDMLAAGDKSAGEIAQQFEISRPAIVKHLRILEEHGLVEIQQVGRERKHHLTPKPLREVHDWINRYETFWKDRLQGLKHLIESKSSDHHK
jgi:DNA-binding transcriptional ArsR family regulator